MEREEVCRTLPDELVERIVSMVPFLSIFKARCLSKSWLARLSSLPRKEQDKAKKLLVTSFHKLVAERSPNWRIFCPVVISMEAIVPYDRAPQNWRKVPSLSFLGENVLSITSDLQLEGALLLILALSWYEPDGHIYVANILNRSWRELPPSPRTTSLCKLHCSKLVLDDNSLGTYKVILFWEDHGANSYFVQMYDSKSDSWTSNDLPEKNCLKFPTVGATNLAYFNGFVYTLPICIPRKLWAFDLEDGNMNVIDLSFTDFVLDDRYFLVVCKTDLLMIIGKTEPRLHFQVVKIDLDSLTLVHLAEGPPEGFEVDMIHQVPISENSCIFFCVADFDDRILQYEIETNTWSWLPFPTSTDCAGWVFPGILRANFSFQPGLSPFAAV